VASPSCGAEGRSRDFLTLVQIAYLRVRSDTAPTHANECSSSSVDQTHWMSLLDEQSFEVYEAR